MSRGRSAATADDVQPAVLRPLFDFGGHRFRLQIELTHLVGRAGVRVATDKRRGNLLHFLNMSPHRVGALSAVHADADHRKV